MRVSSTEDNTMKYTLILTLGLLTAVSNTVAAKEEIEQLAAYYAAPPIEEEE